MLNKRRNLNFELKEGGVMGTLPNNAENTALKAHIDDCLKRSYTMNDFFILLEAINSEDRFKQHFGVIGLRKILSIGKS